MKTKIILLIGMFLVVACNEKHSPCPESITYMFDTVSWDKVEYKATYDTFYNEFGETFVNYRCVEIRIDTVVLQWYIEKLKNERPYILFKADTPGAIWDNKLSITKDSLTYSYIIIQ